MKDPFFLSASPKIAASRLHRFAMDIADDVDIESGRLETDRGFQIVRVMLHAAHLLGQKQGVCARVFGASRCENWKNVDLPCNSPLRFQIERALAGLEPAELVRRLQSIKGDPACRADSGACEVAA